MLKRSITAAAVGVACILVPVTGEAGASTHFGGSITFPDTLCGFTGTTTLSTEDNYGTLSDGGGGDRSFEHGLLLRCVLDGSGLCAGSE
jgi:hypothetical protein